MLLKFDTEKKSSEELVLEKRVPIMIDRKNYVYFMTNDYTLICEKLKALGYRIPKTKDFKVNPALSDKVRRKMASIGAKWSFVITPESSILNYYDSETDSPYIFITGNDESPILRLFQYALDDKTSEIEELAKSGCDIDQCIQHGLTPLMVTCSENSCNALKTLLKLGADINAVDALNQTPLMYTIMKDNVDAAKILLSNPKLNLEIKCIRGYSALNWAAEYEALNVLELLIKKGANPNSVNYNGLSPLMITIIRGRTKATELLIKSGADLNLVDNMGRTPLMISVQKDNVLMAKKLMEAGADISVKDIKGNSLLVVAAEKNAANFIKFFMKAQKVHDEDLEKAVIKAASFGNIDALWVLLENCQNQAEMAFVALMVACLKNKPDVIHLCMDYDCAVDQDFYFGMTPLMMACYADANKAAAQLVAYGANLNKVDMDGVSALMYAASKNNSMLVHLLLRNGADRVVKDKKGRTFEDYTMTFDSRNFIQLIIDRAKSEICDGDLTRKDEIPKTHQTFCERFCWYYQKYFERYPNEKNNKSIWDRGGLSKQTFSKIQKTVNMGKDLYYRPEKKNVIKLAMGMKLTPNEIEDFMQSAGYSFDKKDEIDVEIKKLLSDGVYSNDGYVEWDRRIYAKTGKIFFNTMAFEDENDDLIPEVKGGIYARKN